MGGHERARPRGTGRPPRRDRAPEPWLRAVRLGLRGRAWDLVRGLRPRTVLGLALLSLGLLAAGLGASKTPFLWGLAGCWALTLATAFAVLRACADGRTPSTAPDVR
ncbi:hypothetical protein ACWGKU_30820 [Kitasatospora sp. NPDC054768]|uniref:hypothetical protein n=1 Tax=unclassified Kitasatospora TaxID=2633591 RepID=UPI0033C00FF0